MLEMELHRSYSDVYYLHDYYPTRYKHISEENDRLRRDIWAYKKIEHSALERFTNELMGAIELIGRGIGHKSIGLVAVPPSKVGKASAVGVSIWNICNWCNEGITQSIFGCDKKFYDFGSLLQRISDVSTAHEGRRSTYNEHKESIACTKKDLWRLRKTFILMDDVLTLGTSMDVCRDILIENGAPKDKIIRLVIAKTII